MPMSWFFAYIAMAWVIRVGMVFVVLRSEFTPGTALAWLSIVFFHPYFGGLLYLLIGERRLGRRYARRHDALMAELHPRTRGTAHDLHAVLTDLDPAYAPMVRQVEKISRMPILCATDVNLLSSSPDLVERLVADIDAAQSRVSLLYYIFAPDDTGRRVCDALVSAAKRGVSTRLLVDGVGSRPLLHDRALLNVLKESGVRVAAALPVTPLRRQLARMDLRNHRKLAIIDGRIAYAGSHNLINPDYGGRKGGPWFDLTARLTGSIVREFSAVFVEDWAVETGERLDLPATDDSPNLGTQAQAVPTGPGAPADSYRRVLLAAVQCARRKLILTSPYFVPDDPTIVSLVMAADRGVEVTLILPQTPDHLFTAAAGRSHFEQLLRAGVSIHLYRPGLLHSKTVTVDDAFALIGSANLDVRSFYLNFELSVVLYGGDITARLRQIQESYLADSSAVDLDDWSNRPVSCQYAERAVALLSPLL